MSKEIAKKEETGLLPFGDGVPIKASDIVLPALQLRQNSYRKEHMKAFKPGDIIQRPNNVTLAPVDKPVMFVPISIEKCYRIGEISKNEVKTIGYEPWVEDKPLVEMRDKQQIRRDRAYVAHVLLREDLANQSKMFDAMKKGEMVDPSDFTLPSRIVFTRSSFQAGKILFTHFEMSRTIKQSPAIMSFELRSIESRNDQGQWFSFDVQKVKDPKLKFTPKELLDCCNFWVQAMSQATQFKSIEDEEETIAAAEAAQDVKEEQRF